MAGLPRVSVLLVTKNGARYLAEVLDNVREQQGSFDLEEIIAVDSGSRDGSLDILRKSSVRIVSIPSHEFGHGTTRNLAARHASGEYLVFLTQDATPANTRWLENLLRPLLADPCVVGSYSRHLPRPNCHPMEWRRLAEQELSGRAGSRVNSMRDNPDYAQQPDFFYFFANVSSVIRYDAWVQRPFPDVEFGEDQLWAKQVLEAGYKTAYCADSVVYHSHSYGPWANFRRHFDHVAALHSVSEPHPISSLTRLTDCFLTAYRFAKADVAYWARKQRQTRKQVIRRWALPAMSWHVAAGLGMWFGEHAQQLPHWLSSQFSYQEHIKRQ